MSLLETFQMAMKNILSSKVRTLLTMLGIIIGVCAVIVIVGLGNGMQGYIEESFADMGTDSLTVQILGRGSSRSVSEEQMYALVEENQDLYKQISPTVTMMGVVKIGNDSISTSSITGVSEDYFDMKGYTIAQGRNLDYVDISGRKKVCVVGQYLNMAYFGGSAVGQTLRVRGQTLTVVGVIQQQSDDLEEGGTDDCLFLPYSVAERMAGSVNAYTVTMQDEDHMDESVNALESALYEVFASDDYYTVTSMAEMLDTMTGMINILVYVLAGIAAISLVVGGIGIMNIMLVTVTERTREIGIRKAIGAERKSIITQFLIEAAVICSIGGLIGIGIGCVGTLVAGKLLLNETAMLPSPFITMGAFLFSVVLGVIFGMYPAIKASGLQPVVALRAE